MFDEEKYNLDTASYVVMDDYFNEEFERGGKIVRYSDGRKRRLDTWNRGRSWTMDRKYYNKNEDWEIPMDKRSSKSFLSGSEKETKKEESFLSGKPTETKQDESNWSWLGFEKGGNIFDESDERAKRDLAIEKMKENITYKWQNTDMGSGWKFFLYFGDDLINEMHYIEWYDADEDMTKEEINEDYKEWRKEMYSMNL